MSKIDKWYLENLICPIDKTKLVYKNNFLISETGNKYPVINGIPVMLVKDKNYTHIVEKKTIEITNSKEKIKQSEPYFIETIGVTDKEKELIKESVKKTGKIDPVVSYILVATCGNAYRRLIGNIKEYPIPYLNLPSGNGKRLLDVGCNWGRWTIAAKLKGYEAVGIDPSLGGVLAGQRVANQLGLDIKYIVGDVRYLPFKDEFFDVVFSYSVLQHFSKEDVEKALISIHKVLKTKGFSLIQMPNKIGIRNLMNQTKRGFKEPKNFDVRYWDLNDLKKTFSIFIGNSKLSIDCFFGLGLQKSDARFMPYYIKAIIYFSEYLKKMNEIFEFLLFFADSVYIKSIKY